MASALALCSPWSAREVGPGGEGFSRARQHDDAHLGIGGGGGERLAQRVDERGAERVADLGPVEREGENGAAAGSLEHGTRDV